MSTIHCFEYMCIFPQVERRDWRLRCNAIWAIWNDLIGNACSLPFAYSTEQPNKYLRKYIAVIQVKSVIDGFDIFEINCSGPILNKKLSMLRNVNCVVIFAPIMGPDGCYYPTMTFYWLKLLRLTMNWPINNWPFYSKERSGQLFHGFQEIKLLTRELDNNRRTKNSLGSIGSQTWMNKYRITKILLTLIQNVWWISMSHITVKENGNKCTGRVDFVQSRKNG